MEPFVLANRYQIIGDLATGGFGKTYLAEDTQMPSRRRCVLKQLKAVSGNPIGNQLVQERFQREAAILEKLGQMSDQIPQLYANFSEGGKFYLVQEWVDGITLTDWVEQEGPLREMAVREILSRLLPVLAQVHSQGIVHRDIKPDNIILRYADSKPVLIDFGAVKEMIGTRVQLDSREKTIATIAIGTPGYMPPEQAAGRPVYASDLYSLGLTAIYLLTGKRPTELETDQITGKIRWRQYAGNVSPALAKVLERAIAPSAGDRFGTASDLLVALYSQTTVMPTVISRQAPQQKQQKQKKKFSSLLGLWQKGAIASSLIGSVLMLGLSLTFASPPSQPSPIRPRTHHQPLEPLPIRKYSPTPKPGIPPLSPTPAAQELSTDSKGTAPETSHQTLSPHQKEQNKSSEKQLDRLADISFYTRHPELQGRKLRPWETKLVKEWVQIRSNLPQDFNQQTDKLFHEQLPQLGERKIHPSEADLQLKWQKINRCDAVVDYIFYSYHPELKGRKIQPEEMDFVREWSAIRDRVSGCN